MYDISITKNYTKIQDTVPCNLRYLNHSCSGLCTKIATNTLLSFPSPTILFIIFYIVYYVNLEEYILETRTMLLNDILMRNISPV